MSRPKILILDTIPGLTQLTVNSLKKNSPDWEYEVLPNVPRTSRIKAALESQAAQDCLEDDVLFCVTSGCYLNINDNTFPPEDMMARHHLLMSNQAVFFDNEHYVAFYQTEGIEKLLNAIDLSVFILNPTKWNFIPETDSGFYSKIQTRKMPRYMNHRWDPLLEAVVGARHGFKYSLVGETAAVLNYVDKIETGQVTVSDCWSLCFDLLEDCIEGVAPAYRENILKMSEKQKKTVGAMRTRFNKVFNEYPL